MSATTTPDPQPAVAPATPPPERLVTVQAIIAVLGMGIVYLVVGKILWNGTDQLQSQVLLLASGACGTILGFYLGSSKGSQDKDAKMPLPVVAPVVPAVTVPTIVAPALAENTAATRENTAATEAETRADTKP